MLITVFVPKEANFHCFEVNGIVNGSGTTTRNYARMLQDRIVVDLPRRGFISLLQAPNGLLWERENPDAMAWLGQNQSDPPFPVFPGAASLRA
jgi:hypothetical protein